MRNDSARKGGLGNNAMTPSAYHCGYLLRLLEVAPVSFLLALVMMAVAAITAGCRDESRPPTVGPTKRLSEGASKTDAKTQIKPVGEKELAYSIELQQSGSSQRVRESHPFRSHDGFRLLIRPGFPAYLYLLNRGARGSRFRLLFPSEAVTLRNPLPAGQQATVPNDPKWMRMDQNPGEENFIIVASTIALPELNRSPYFDRDHLEGTLADIERRYRPQSSRRFEDGDWVKIFAADGGKDIALVLRIPLKHN